MFYKSASRSTVLSRLESQRPQAAAREDVVLNLADDFFAAARDQGTQPKPKLSDFEQELFRAWFDD
jgi:hypothetical protein